MTNIQRYSIGLQADEDPNGKWVLYSDAMKEIQRVEHESDLRDRRAMMGLPPNISDMDL